MSEALTGFMTHFSTQFCAVAGTASFVKSPRWMHDVSLTMGLMSTDRSFYPQKIPTVLPAIMPEMCAVSPQFSRGHQQNVSTLPRGISK